MVNFIKETYVANLPLKMQKRNDFCLLCVMIAPRLEVVSDSKFSGDTDNLNVQSKRSNGESMKLNKLSQFALAALCFASVSATASAATQTVWYEATVGKDLTDLFGTLNFQQFDSTKGALTGVHIDFLSSVTGQVDLQGLNSLAAAKPVNVSLNVDLSVQRPDSSNLISLTGEKIFSSTIPVSAGQFISTQFGKDVSASIDLTPSDFALFTGSGFVLAPLSVYALTEGDATNVDVTFTTYASGYGKVTYTYETAPVPEPETYAMLLLGLGVVAGVAKRKSRAQQA